MIKNNWCGSCKTGNVYVRVAILAVIGFASTLIYRSSIGHFSKLPKLSDVSRLKFLTGFRKGELLTSNENLSQVDKQDDFDRSIFNYRPPVLANVTRDGKRLIVDRGLMASLGIPLSEYINLTRSNVNDFVFVTATSSNHFSESIDSVASVQTNMPGYKIIYYDLGLKSDQVKQLKTFCNLDYRKFDFSKYPKHVAKLTTYAFKPLIVQEVLLTHPGAIWMDASVRVLKNLSSVYDQVLQTGGFLQFWHSPHFNGAVIHPDQYSYLPTDVHRQENVPTRGAAPVVIFKTAKIYWSLFHWWVMCALDVDCIAPKGAVLGCRFHQYGTHKWAHCHRFDQAALNLLAANLYGYDAGIYTARDVKAMVVIKHATSKFKVRRC